MEAAARTAYYLITGENLPKERLTLNPVRGIDGIREAKLTIGATTLRLAVIHGTANAKHVLEQLQNGEKTYDFIEVMTCKGGCIGGGGQPKTGMPDDSIARFKRIAALYNRDRDLTCRVSHENPDIKRVYDEFYGAPLSKLAEHMLHTSYTDRSSDLGPVHGE